jgi:hypothetical protein
MNQAKNILVMMLVVIFLPTLTWATNEKIVLTSGTLPDGGHAYYHELLRESLKLIGYDLDLKVAELPQKRAEGLLDKNALSIYWFLPTKERDNRGWVKIRFGLTNGLIGQRVLFIPKGKQNLYNEVRNLDDFRNLGLRGAFGVNWFDVKVWKQNALNYETVDGDWHVIYGMLAAGNRKIDYFSRGVIEIIAESKLYPELEIEKNLMFVYDRDFFFYMNKTDGARYKDIIKKALIKAKSTGLMDKLLRKHFLESIDQIGYKKRLKIKLQKPLE